MGLPLIETVLYPEPATHIAGVRGKAFVHVVMTATGAQTCETPWPTSRCVCGYHTLQWAVSREDLREGGSAG